MRSENISNTIAASSDAIKREREREREKERERNFMEGERLKEWKAQIRAMRSVLEDFFYDDGISDDVYDVRQPMLVALMLETLRPSHKSGVFG